MAGEQEPTWPSCFVSPHHSAPTAPSSIVRTPEAPQDAHARARSAHPAPSRRTPFVPSRAHRLHSHHLAAATRDNGAVRGSLYHLVSYSEIMEVAGSLGAARERGRVDDYFDFFVIEWAATGRAVEELPWCAYHHTSSS
jgi:hypothetical protein